MYDVVVCLTADELRQIGELEALEADRDGAALLLDQARTRHALRLAQATLSGRSGAAILQHQSALGAAHVVAQDHVPGPLAGQLGTVGDAQRGTLRALARADAAGAGRREGRVAHVDLLAADVAALDDVLSPRAQIDLLHGVAGHAWVEEVAGQIERGTLHVALVVQILANDAGQCRLADFG